MPPAKHRTPAVPAKIKIVVEELLSQHVYDLAAAAAKAGLTHYWARRYLQQSHVLQFFREQRAAMIEEVCAGNAAALAKVRAESDNGMAIVAACRQLEALRQAVAEETGSQSRTRPGLQIVIHTPGAEPRIICGPTAPPLQIEGEAERVTEMEP
jgi:hypothetical protein